MYMLKKPAACTFYEGAEECLFYRDADVVIGRCRGIQFDLADTE